MNNTNEITKGLAVLLNVEGIVEGVYTETFPNNLISDPSELEDEYGEINLISVLSVMRETDNIEDDHVEAGMLMVHLGVLQEAQVKQIDTGFWIVIDGPDRLVVAYPKEEDWIKELNTFSSHKGPYNLNAMYAQREAVRPVRQSGVEYYNSFADDDYKFLLLRLGCEAQDAGRMTGEEDAAMWQKLYQIAKHAVDRAKAAEEGGAA